MIIHTGTVVTEEHLQIVLELARGVVSAPLIIVHGRSLPDLERVLFGDWLDALAQAYGLPSPQKNAKGETVHYGMTDEGEFLRWEGDPNACGSQDILGT